MLNRRRFLQCLAAAAAVPTVSGAGTTNRLPGTGLRDDPDRILDLPDGFSYRLVSRAGDLMSDGLSVPGAHDGMAAFAGHDGRVILICNHELAPPAGRQSAFGDAFDKLPEEITRKFYDRGGDRTPGAGGTTTTVYNPQTGVTERQHLSLAGTEYNCAGGPTPWGSWLSCEECFEVPGTRLMAFRLVTREQPHGYVFEVPAGATGLVEARPIKAMGRFEHEACAVHAASGIVYMTEDQQYSLFYRYIPNVPGKLPAGGRLQALAIEDAASVMTHNWGKRGDVPVGEALATRWIDLHDVDPEEDDLRLRGAELGATMFARGEGLCAADDDLVFTCTIGGRARLGQVFAYRPSEYEGTSREAEAPGKLTLIAEADDDSLLQNADNITIAPWGDLLVCEDGGGHCGLVGIRPDGSQYPVAFNPYSYSELAGVCFAPDGATLFVNIQYPGMTVAITGPWPEELV